MPDLRDCDAIDRKLLGALQRDCLRTADDLATEIPLSPSAIARRIRRLRDAGVIERGVAVVSERGGFLSALVDVQLDRHAIPEIDALRRRLSASDHVQMLLEVSGAFDLTLLIIVTDMAAFNVFVDEMLGSERVVRRYETRFIKRRRKFSTALPLGDD